VAIFQYVGKKAAEKEEVLRGIIKRKKSFPLEKTSQKKGGASEEAILDGNS